MKKFFLSVFALSALFVTSCSDDDDNTNNDGDEVTIDPSDFQLTLNDGDEAELDASKTYQLTGPVVVQSGASLTIPAGTKISASGGTSAYIAVAQGGKIFIEGEANNPVVMTSANETPAPGDWGGLVVCGKAPTNKGGDGGQTATAEVSNLTYGGSEVSDNSGSIKYLRLEYTGAEFNGDKQFNGLSLFGVGNGTTVDYVQSYMGKDDGVEFFGGTVEGNHLVSIGSGDDSIDFADGWNGSGNYWYIKGGTKAGIEGSNNGDNGAATPMTDATISNVSIVGGGSEGGFFIKEGGGKWAISNVYINGYEKGIYIKPATDDPEANSQVAAGEITFTNIQFDEVDNVTDYAGDTSFITEGTSTGAGNGADMPSWAAGWTID
ncbi:hypothetical protein [Mesonia aestuariivivens]|uniref:Multidrug transporter n=1 Tax=Mesonia aestuariivivens TaxID=2796128 RepID=A0ABS6W008_9FLAO|nr:hypothetical protein [Mesonia aestuariivivens]MBW2960478.1 hypothetical protein [Mesonia aestuariivivens]